MLFFFRQILIFISFMLLYNQEIEANQKRLINNNPSKYVNNEVWRQVQNYLIPDNHPIKEKLNEIFSRSRALADQESMKAAGFDTLPPQHQTQMIVAKHPELRGYVLKIYLDEQKYYRGRPEHYHWIKRIKGTRLIRAYLNKHGDGSLFKAPQKWIYLLPDDPSPPSHDGRKNFILVAEDMELFDEKMNESLWGSEWVTEDLLKTLYRITTDLGLRDSANPSNCPLSIDGKGAFVDTEVYHRSDVRYWKLTPFLSPSMQAYWKKITKNKSQPPHTREVLEPHLKANVPSF